MHRNSLVIDPDDTPTVNLLGLQSPRHLENQNQLSDTRTGIPPAFSAAARARWASEREARGLEAFISRRC